MYVAYFDEVKANPKAGNHCYFVGGIVVKMGDIAGLEAMMTKLSEDIFETSDLLTETEFHASHLYFAKSHFRGMPIEKRLEIFRRLGEILNHRDKIKLVYACINTDKLYSGTNAAEQAFMHFVERVHLSVEKDSCALLIGDLDDQQARNMVSDFSRYRTRGTNSKYGVQIDRVVDSVHFSRSHHSRMIQLADVYLFFLSGMHQPRTGTWRTS